MQAYDASHFNPPAPVAKVSLRNPQSHKTVDDILMVIDTGADMSFLPSSVVQNLDLQFEVREEYQLAAFDGAPSTARAVRADMLFVGRTFKGLFLVRDSQFGIVGRDVLDRVAVLLDGPNLNWREPTGS